MIMHVKDFCEQPRTIPGLSVGAGEEAAAGTAPSAWCGYSVSVCMYVRVCVCSVCRKCGGAAILYVCVCREIERQRARERAHEKEREIERERQTDRQTDRDRG